MSKNIAYLAALLVVILSACGKYNCQHSVGLRMAFVSFTQAQTDTIIIKRFVKGTNFAQLLDSALVDTSLIRYTSRGDTLYPEELHIHTLLSSLYDYQVTIPQAAKVFSVTEISEEEKKVRRGLFSSNADLCFNPIRAYTLNGSRKTVIPNHEILYLDN